MIDEAFEKRIWEESRVEAKEAEDLEKLESEKAPSSTEDSPSFWTRFFRRDTSLSERDISGGLF